MPSLHQQLVRLGDALGRRLVVGEDDLEFEEVPQAGHSVEMDTRSAVQEHRAHLLDTTDLTQCLDEQFPQGLGIRGREALVEGLLGRGLIVATVIDELAGTFRAGTQLSACRRRMRNRCRPAALPTVPGLQWTSPSP